MLTCGPTPSVYPRPHNPPRFLAGSDSDSDSDGDRRVVLKSAKDKRFSELGDTCDEIRVRGAATAARPGDAEQQIQKQCAAWGTQRRLTRRLLC
jgi:hypothetical protein